MQFDWILKGGRVIDGSGLPGFTADVGIVGDRIARIGRIDAPARRVWDADGLVVAPGFIDVHTHYDVQLDWDPLATPSAWHGVTTVLAGNCGFTVAPARPHDVDWLAGMLTRVEGMSRAALAAGWRFAGGGFADYWSRLDGKLGVNVGSYVGHSAVRRYVMGEDASTRAATPAEIAAMQELVRQGMREGAVGFSTSQVEVHRGEDGRPVPSNLASPEEIVALCAVLAEFDRGAIEIIPRSFTEGYDEPDRALLLAMYRASGKPVELNPLTPSNTHRDGWKKTLEWVRKVNAEGARLYPMCSVNKLEAHLRLCDTFLFDEIDSWREVLCLPHPQRMAALRDPAVRKRMAEELADSGRRAFTMEVSNLSVEEATVPANAHLVGRGVAEIARERGQTPLDCFLDLCLSEDLRMNFESNTMSLAADHVRKMNAAALAEPWIMPGSSDGGAHLASFCGADYSTRLITDWVPESLTLEQAIHRLTGMPATVHGMIDRGFLRVGARADVVLFDPTRLRAAKARLVEDFPGPSARYVVDAEGYEGVIVNGVPVMEKGKPTGARPGVVLQGA
jgi:N-acyl-D-aspartate/D-glutamate deacylase